MSSIFWTLLAFGLATFGGWVLGGALERNHWVDKADNRVMRTPVYAGRPGFFYVVPEAEYVTLEGKALAWDRHQGGQDGGADNGAG